jgi:hypothetical protein
VPGTGSAGSSTTGGARPQNGTSGGSTGSVPRPVSPTAKTVEIGIEYDDEDAAHAAGTVIGSQAGVTDEQAVYTILINDLNSRGGLLGRKIVPVFHAYNSTGDDPDVQGQALCTSFTQDHKVFAAIIFAAAEKVSRDCLARAGVVIIRARYALDDDADFRRIPAYAAVGALSLDRLAAVYVDGLAAQGFFSSTSRIGVITQEEPAYMRSAKGPLRAALARHGLKVQEEAFVPGAGRAQDAGDQSAAVQSAVLRFNSQRIDRVLFVTLVGLPALIFANTAQAQRYHPRYGLNSNHGLDTLRGLAPAEQLAGSKAVGWVPLLDVPSTEVTLSPAAKRCDALLRSKGHSPADQSVLAFDLAACDQLATLAAALARGGQLSSGGFVAGLERLGTSVATGLTFQLRSGPGRHDTAGAIRHVAFQESCGCFRYSGSLVPV